MGLCSNGFFFTVTVLKSLINLKNSLTGSRKGRFFFRLMAVLTDTMPRANCSRSYVSMGCQLRCCKIYLVNCFCTGDTKSFPSLLSLLFFLRRRWSGPASVCPPVSFHGESKDTKDGKNVVWISCFWQTVQSHLYKLLPCSCLAV